MADARKLPSGSWRVQLYLGRDKNGKKITKSFTAATRWQAEKAADEYLANGMVSESPNKITVGEAIDNYLALKENVLSPSTIRGYRVIRRTRFQCLMDVDIHDVTSFKVQQAINEDAPRIGRKSINDAKSLLTSALKLYDIKIELNVTLPQKRPNIKDMPMATQVIQAIKGTEIELPCLLAIWLSLRMSEVAGLQFGDISGDTILVQRSVVYSEKGYVVRNVNKTYDSTRRLKLHPYLLGLIMKIPHQKEDEFIIAQKRQYIYKHFKKHMKEHGIDITFHDLRHMSASIMLALGVPDKYAMERGGWATPSTLKSVYQHTFSDERKLVDRKIDAFFEKLLDEE